MTRQGGPVVLLDQAVSPERRAELLEFFGEAFPFYDGPGGSRMALYEDRTRPGHFVELVLFEDEAAWRQSEARLETDPSMTTMLGRWRAHLARDPTVLQLVPVTVPRAQVGVRSATSYEIEQVWTERWGTPIFSPTGLHGPDEVEGLIAHAGSTPRGLVTWIRDAGDVEIVTLDAWPAGYGVGGVLLTAAEQHLVSAGVDRLHLGTTNDNLDAVAFYQRRGWRVVEVRLDGVDRDLKPSIPELGHGGVPVRDVWILEKSLR